MSAVLHPAPLLASRRQHRPVRKSLSEQAARLKQLKEQRAQGSGITADALHEGQALPEGDDDASPPLEAKIEEPPASSLAQLVADPSIRMSPVAKVYQTIENQTRQSNKENIEYTKRSKAFIDRQEGARRMPWNDNDMEASAGRPPKQVSPRKKPRNAEQVDREDEDDDDDDDFVAMSLPAADGRRRELRDKTGGRPIVHRPLSERPRSEIPESAHSPASRNEDSDYASDNGQDQVDQQLNDAVAGSTPIPFSQRTLSSSRRLPPSTQPARPRLSPRSNIISRPSSLVPVGTAPYLERVRESARRTVATTRPRRVQSRSAYSQAEEERLIELIEEHGSSYSLLKQMDEHHTDGPLLMERTQVHLKDKAQELKFQFLKYVLIIISPHTL